MNEVEINSENENTEPSENQEKSEALNPALEVMPEGAAGISNEDSAAAETGTSSSRERAENMGLQPAETGTSSPLDGQDENPPLPLIRDGVKNSLHFKLAMYDGPLDLLLELIKKNEMDIYNIPVAEITRQYLESLAQMKQLDLEVAGEYIVLAATLIYIKSKMLLPIEKEDDEDDEGGDPRAELVRKLLEYQAFKEAAKELGLLEDERGKAFTRQIADYYLAGVEAEDVEIDTFSGNLFDLLSAFQTVLTRMGRTEMHEVFEQIITIEEKMVEIKSLLNENKRVSFFELFGERWTRNQLIATFLAILEIVRTKFARVMQDAQFAEIIVEKLESAG